MATIERAVMNFEAILRAEFPLALATIAAEWNDGVDLQAPVSYHWEEVPEKIGATPAVLIIAEGEDQTEMGVKDSLFNATLRVYVVITGREKRELTQRIFRYADAMKRIVRKPFNRTLYQHVVSAKIPAIRYSNTFVDRDQLFARDFSAEVTLRLPQ